ncbi:hypothetical protein L1049_003225 [Liquidambar formosana]|uniref:Uncharacterized protein n=1 Tax=Liquidambar formosana TaxID=63359 RepID=A0AAP0R7C9_LIQFO
MRAEESYRIRRRRRSKRRFCEPRTWFSRQLSSINSDWIKIVQEGKVLGFLRALKEADEVRVADLNESELGGAIVGADVRASLPLLAGTAEEDTTSMLA